MKIPHIHAHCLNGFLWFVNKAWKPRHEDEIVREAVKYKKKIRGLGVALEDGFAYLSSGHSEHKSLNTKTPWVWDKSGKEFILNEWNPRWWGLAKRWLQISADIDYDAVFHLFMGFHYNLVPFKLNREGLHATHIWDNDLWLYQKRYIKKLMRLYKPAYGVDYKPTVKIGNEFAHSGSGRKYHDIMYFHERARKLLDRYTDIEHLIFDLHASEGAIGECRDKFNCPKPEQCDRGGVHGNDEDDRKAILEYHGFSCWEDFTRLVEFKGRMRPIIDIYLSSANKRARFTEDCGSRTPPKPGVGKGSIWPPSNSGLSPSRTWANRKQSKIMARELFKVSQGRIIFGWYPVNNIQWVMDNGMVRHEFDHRFEVIKPEYRRLKQIVKAWKEQHG